MDVAEFFSEFRRMCKSSSDCAKCEYHGDRCDNAIELLEETVAKVEKWSQEHPRKTWQDVFLEQWPEAELDTNGAVAICPTILSSDYRSANKRCKHPGTACSDCRREFWMQEVE